MIATGGAVAAIWARCKTLQRRQDSSCSLCCRIDRQKLNAYGAGSGCACRQTPVMVQHACEDVDHHVGGQSGDTNQRTAQKRLHRTIRRLVSPTRQRGRLCLFAVGRYYQIIPSIGRGSSAVKRLWQDGKTPVFLLQPSKTNDAAEQKVLGGVALGVPSPSNWPIGKARANRRFQTFQAQSSGERQRSSRWPSPLAGLS
jgi:hypothetical protein